MSTIKTINLQHPSSASNNIVLDSTGNATVAGTLVAGSSMGWRNRLINPAFEIWQRGTSSTTNNSYVADRWFAVNFSSALRSTDAPSGFRFSHEITGTSFPGLIQRIEAANSFDLVGRQITVSFWAKNVSGTALMFAEILTPNALDNFSAVTAFAATTLAPVGTMPSSWTYYTTTFAALPANAANGLELRIERGDASASTTRITGVQLEVGSVATPFERRQYGQELALCQRYAQSLSLYINAASASRSYELIRFCPPMRAAPTVSSSASGFNPTQITVDGTAANQTTASISTILASAEL